MVNWKQRELEWARTAAMVKERQLRELKEQVAADHDESDLPDARGARHRHGKRGNSRQ